MTKIQRKQLLQLIEFLENPESFSRSRQFDLGAIAEDCCEMPECPTVACAIGWTPLIFPDLVRWRKRDILSSCLCFEMLDHPGQASFPEVAEYLFGIPYALALNLFSPNSQGHVHRDIPDCPRGAWPARFASSLRDFLRLVDMGELHLIPAA